MKNVTLLSSLLFSTASMTSLTAHADITANVAVDSNYYWRGITQTDDGAAVSGGIDYNNETGFYLGSWASNVDFQGDSPSYEIDFYAGFSKEIDDFSYDIGYVYYAYPDATASIDFGELYGSVSWQWLSAKVSYLSNAQSGASIEEDLLYLELNANFEVLNKTELSFHIGQSQGDTVTEWFEQDDSYLDYGISLAKSGFKFSLLKTDLTGEDDLKVVIGYRVDFTL